MSPSCFSSISASLKSFFSSSAPEPRRHEQQTEPNAQKPNDDDPLTARSASPDTTASMPSPSPPPPPPPPPPFHIAIIGAGIGGLTFAIGCLKKGISYTLYESAAQYSTVGAGVGLGPNALKALAMIDPQLRTMYDGISSGNLTPGKDHVMMDMLYAEPNFGEDRGWAPAPFGADCYERTSAHRVDLLNILTSMIPRETVQFNKRVKTIVQGGGGAEGTAGHKVTVTFEDGDVVTADAVVGSDGAKGPTRGFVLGAQWPEQVKATYSGRYVYRSIVPMADALQILGHHAGDAEVFLGKDVKFLTFPISRGAHCNLVAFKFTKEPWTHDQWTKRVTREQMAADFDGVDPRLVKLLDWAEPLQWSLHHHLDTPIYYNDRICLLGDSAHATTPHQASGAGQCIEDALVLAHILAQVAGPQGLTEAFRVYDSIRRPRAQKVVRTSVEAGNLYSFNDPECGADMDKITANFRQRFLWIWEHDLQADLDTADAMLAKARAA